MDVRNSLYLVLLLQVAVKVLRVFQSTLNDPKKLSQIRRVCIVFMKFQELFGINIPAYHAS